METKTRKERARRHAKPSDKQRATLTIIVSLWFGVVCARVRSKSYSLILGIMRKAQNRLWLSMENQSFFLDWKKLHTKPANSAAINHRIQMRSVLFSQRLYLGAQAHRRTINSTFCLGIPYHRKYTPKQKCKRLDKNMLFHAASSSCSIDQFQSIKVQPRWSEESSDRGNEREHKIYTPRIRSNKWTQLLNELSALRIRMIEAMLRTLSSSLPPPRIHKAWARARALKSREFKQRNKKCAQSFWWFRIESYKINYNFLAAPLNRWIT